MKVLEFPKQMDTESALSVIDDMRKAVAEGKIKAFICVGIDSEHQLYGFSASTKTTTRLEMMGAMMALQHSYIDGAL